MVENDLSQTEWSGLKLDIEKNINVILFYKNKIVGILIITMYNNLLKFHTLCTINSTIQNVHKFLSFVAIYLSHVNNKRYVASRGLPKERTVYNYNKRSVYDNPLKESQLTLIQEFSFRDLYLTDNNNIFNIIYAITNYKYLDTAIDLYEDSILNYAYYRHVLKTNPKELITEL